MMSHRTGTPMRLVSPAPVATAPVLTAAAPRPPQIYQPAQQGASQTIYSQNNNNNMGGKKNFSVSYKKNPASLQQNECFFILFFNNKIYKLYKLSS